MPIQNDLFLFDEGATKVQQLAKLAADAQACKACRHHKLRKQVVFSDGPPDAKIVLVGEAPGRNEDLTGLPFTGKSGDLLNKILKAVNLKRSDIYICNVLKCRPKDNEEPGMAALKACRRYLEIQLVTVSPKVILAAGNWAMRGIFLDNSVRITREEGIERNYEGVVVIPCLHPAFILRSQGSPNENEYKRSTWKIWKRAVELAYPEKVTWEVK